MVNFADMSAEELAEAKSQLLEVEKGQKKLAKETAQKEAQQKLAGLVGNYFPDNKAATKVMNELEESGFSGLEFSITKVDGVVTTSFKAKGGAGGGGGERRPGVPVSEQFEQFATEEDRTEMQKLEDEYGPNDSLSKEDKKKKSSAQWALPSISPGRVITSTGGYFLSNLTEHIQCTVPCILLLSLSG